MVPNSREEFVSLLIVFVYVISYLLRIDTVEMATGVTLAKSKSKTSNSTRAAELVSNNCRKQESIFFLKTSKVKLPRLRNLWITKLNLGLNFNMIDEMHACTFGTMFNTKIDLSDARYVKRPNSWNDSKCINVLMSIDSLIKHLELLTISPKRRQFHFTSNGPYMTRWYIYFRLVLQQWRTYCTDSVSSIVRRFSSGNKQMAQSSSKTVFCLSTRKKRVILARR